MIRDGQEWRAIARAHLHTHVNTFRRAINHMPKPTLQVRSSHAEMACLVRLTIYLGARLDLSQITRLGYLLELRSDAI